MKLRQAVGFAALLITLSAQTLHAQFPFFNRNRQRQTQNNASSSYTYSTQPGTAAQPAANPYQNPYGGYSRVQPYGQQPAADPAAQTGYANPYQNPDPSMGPSSHAGYRYEEVIAPDEQPGPMAALAVPSAGFPQAGMEVNGRRINFPRDRADDVDVLKLQVFLDYHGYSPGEIDGQWGYNTERALYIYQKNNALPTTGQIDDKVIGRLNAFQDGFLLDYTVTQKDAEGPYRRIPRDYYEQARLKWLPYESQCEALAEKFHCSQTLLRKLNPGIDLDNAPAGTRILGLNVIDGIDEKRGAVAKVRISKHNKWTEVFDSEDRFMFYYPSTLGSQYDPLPLGNWEITNVVPNPPFKYQPKLFWDSNPNEPEAMIPPGPNSPVGPVWIGTSRKSVGIHGTPNPENISKNTSHGCIRLSNWDAQQLAKRVKPGTKLEFVE